MTAEEVIARLSVHGEAAFVSAMGRAERAVSSVGHAARRAGEDLIRGFTSPMGMVLGAVSAAGLAEFVSGALRAASATEEFKAQLMGLGYTAEQAQKKLDFTRALAVPSRFQFSELRQATIMLEGMGMRAEKVLPLVAKLAMGSGRTGQEGREMAARFFQRIYAGEMPELEAMTGLGMTRQDLARQGLFSTGGMAQSQGLSLRGDAAIDAAARAVNAKFGNIFETMKDTIVAKMSSLRDAWEQMMEKIGAAIARDLLPYVETLSGWIHTLLDSKWLENLANSVGKVFDAGQKGQKGFVYALSYVTAYLEYLPQLTKTAMGGTLDLISGIGKGFKYAFWGLEVGAIAVWNVFRLFGSWAIRFVAFLKGLYGQQAERADLLRTAAGLATPRPLPRSPGEEAAVLQGSIDKRAADLRAKFDKYMRENAGIKMPEGAEQGPASRFAQDAAATYLPKIARHTERMAATMDLRRFALGGGELGRLGVTPLEFAGVQRGTRQIEVRLSNGHSLDRIVAEAIQKAINEMRRRGEK